MEKNSFVGAHSASSQTSARQTLHPVKSMASFVIDWFISDEVVCFACLWKHGLCPHTPYILLLELRRSCGLDLDCLRIVILSLAHRAQSLVSIFLNTLIVLPCQMMLKVIPLRWLAGEGIAFWNRAAKCLACQSDFSTNLTSFWASLKCCISRTKASSFLLFAELQAMWMVCLLCPWPFGLYLQALHAAI